MCYCRSSPRWWSGWLVLAEVRLGRAESPLLLLIRLGWLFSNETGGQETVRLMGVPDTWKWDLDPHAGIEKEDWEGPRGFSSGKRGQWGGGLPTSGRGLSDRSRKVAGQQLLQGPLSDKRQKAHLCIRSGGCKLSCLVRLCLLTGLQGLILFYSVTIHRPRISAEQWF